MAPYQRLPPARAPRPARERGTVLNYQLEPEIEAPSNRLYTRPARNVHEVNLLKRTHLATRRRPAGPTAATTTLLSMGQRSDGDFLFERYLAEQGVAIPEHEPDLGIGKRIDYPVTIGGLTCLCEVKEFAPTTQSVIPGSMHDL